MWAQARREAVRHVRRRQATDRTKQVASRAAATVYHDAKSTAYRNRKQLGPWLLAAPYVAVGQVANLLALYGTGNPAGISAVTAAAALAVTLLLWRCRLCTRVPAKFREKLQAGLAVGCVWATVVPLVHGTGVAGIWLALLAMVCWSSLSWWREHDHPIPPVTDTAPQLAEPDSGGDNLFARQLMADWDTYVAGMGTLPESRLTTPKRIQYGYTFSLSLVRGKQKLSDARTAKDRIAAALNLNPAQVSIDPDTRPGVGQTSVVLIVITDKIDNGYIGPRITHNGGDVFIDIGPYEDGIGSERFHVLSDQLSEGQLGDGHMPRGSVNGGFVLGTKGSGKSRLMEEIAVGLRALGIEIWYLDPQGGKSSPALMAEADWPLAGVHSTRGAYANVITLWKALSAACEVREAEGGTCEQGFQHTRYRPAIMVMIDECHDVFQADNPDTNNSFGEDFADLDRVMRKNGIGLFGASQSITQDTFGRGNKSAVLRDGMAAVNVFLMAYGGKNLKLAPGYDDQPCGSLPMNRGYGYNPRGQRPHIRWQTRYTPDFRSWLAHYPPATLDTRVQKRIGETYLRRFDQHADNQAAKQTWLAQLDASHDGSSLPQFGLDTTTRHSAQTPREQTGTVTTLLSPSQRRQPATHHEQETPTTSAERPAAEAESLTGTRAAIKHFLAAEPGHSPTSLGHAFGITSQVAGRHLRKLADNGHVDRDRDGHYRTSIR